MCPTCPPPPFGLAGAVKRWGYGLNFVKTNLGLDPDPDWIQIKQQSWSWTGFIDYGSETLLHRYPAFIKRIVPYRMSPPPRVGAVKRWCSELTQKSGPREEHLFCVVDLHAITLPQNPPALRHTRILSGFSYLVAVSVVLLVTLLVWRVRRGLVGCGVA